MTRRSLPARIGGESTVFIVVYLLRRVDSVEQGKGTTFSLVSTEIQRKDHLARICLVSTHESVPVLATHIFEERDKRHGPDDGGHPTNDIFLSWNWTVGRPDSIEYVEGRGT